MVKMICSCGAMMEHADDPALTVSIEAGKWREDHAACASRLGRITTTEEPCPTCAAKDAELKAYKANSFCAFCAGKEEELKEQTRKSDVIIAAKDAAMWRKDREIDSLRARIEVLERFLADNADYDQMTEKDQEWFIENVHKKYYPENY